MTIFSMPKLLARTTLALAALLASLAIEAPAFAQQVAAAAKSTQPPTPEEQYRQVMNNNTITILGASLTGAYIKIVEDIAKAVSDGESLRVLPIVGDGGSQNIKDLLYMRGVDAGIVMSTSLDVYRGKPLYGNLPARLQYIARLYEEEFHIVSGTGIASLAELNGRKIGFHGGAFVSGQELFSKLKVKPSEAVQVDFFKGLDQVKSGEIAAIVRATASPMQDLDAKFDPAVHRLVPIPFPDNLIESRSARRADAQSLSPYRRRGQSRTDRRDRRGARHLCLAAGIRALSPRRALHGSVLQQHRQADGRQEPPSQMGRRESRRGAAGLAALPCRPGMAETQGLSSPDGTCGHQIPSGNALLGHAFETGRHQSGEGESETLAGSAKAAASGCRQNAAVGQGGHQPRSLRVRTGGRRNICLVHRRIHFAHAPMHFLSVQASTLPNSGRCLRLIDALYQPT